jgi:uncharacterized membrane protein YbhN (UPF0104 family)
LASSTPGTAAASGWRRALVIGLTLAALGSLAGFLILNRGYIAEHYVVRPGAVLGLALLVVSTLGLRGLAHRALFGRMGISASAFDWFRVVSVSSFTNYLPFSAGLVAKAFFLNRVHSLPYKRFAVGQTALLLIFVSTNGAVGLVTLALSPTLPMVGLVAAAFALMSGAAVVLFLPTASVARLSGGRVRWRSETAAALRRAVPGVVVVQTAILLASAGILRIAFGMGSSDVGFAACLVFASAAVLTRLVSITPGAIGIRELLMGGLAYLTGFSPRDAVIATAAARTIEIAVIFTLGGLFTHRLSAQVMSSFEEPEQR